MDTWRGGVGTNACCSAVFAGSRRQERRMLPADGKCPAISAAERRAGVARCYLSKLTGKLIEEEQQLSAAVTIGGVTYKATIDTGATASFIGKDRRATWLPSGRLRGYDGKLGWQNRCATGGGYRVREQATEHEPADTTRGSGFISVGMELSKTSQYRD